MSQAETKLLPPSLHYGYCTEKGRREENQDALLLLPERYTFAVADGAGGHDFGRRTSELTVEAFQTELEQCHELETEFLYFLLQRKYKQVNEHIYQLGKKLNNKLVTTMSVLNFIDGNVIVSNVGDTKIYRIRQREVKLLSKVHNVAHELLEKKEITEEQLKNHEKKHMLTMAIGGTKTMDPFLKISRAQKGDVYVICTDGVYQFVNDDDLRDLFSEKNRYTNEELSARCKQIVAKALANGGDDNLTIVAVSYI